MGGSQDALVELQNAYEAILTDLKRGYQAKPQNDQAASGRDTGRTELWEQGDKVAWARSTWREVSRFFTEIMRSGFKGLALLCAALIGIGSVLDDTEIVRCRSF